MNWFIVVFFCISIIIFVITKYYRLKNVMSIEKIEEFEIAVNLSQQQKLLKHHGITIHYLTIEEARALIIKIKSGEYITGMNQANLSARKCLNKDDLYNKYLDGFDSITKTDKDTIDAFINELLDNIKNKTDTTDTTDTTDILSKYSQSYYNYVVKWLKTISIAKAKPWLEAGMPHTLDKTIVMDADWFVKPRKTTFLHEIAHVHQRESLMDFEDLYSALGYIYNPVNIRGLEEIYPLNRNNPDGTSKYWLWHNKSNNHNQNYWWIGAIFKNVNPTSLTDVNLVALELDYSNDDKIYYYLKQNQSQLSTLQPFINFFGENPNNYHPNEMTAKFAEWYLNETLGINDTNTYNYEGYIIYKKYFENMIKKYYT